MRNRADRVVLSSVLCLGLGAALAFAASDRPRPVKPDFDTRLPAANGERQGFVLRQPTPTQQRAAEDLARQMPGLTMRWDGMSGSPKWIAATLGASLSPPSSAAPEVIARSLLRSHADLLGLRPDEVEALRVSSIVPGAGGAHVHFAQTAGGLEVVGGGANVNINRDGSVRSLGTHLYAGAGRLGPAALTAPEAARIAALDVYPDILFTGQVATAEKDGQQRTVLSAEGMGRDVVARLVLLPMRQGTRLAWEVDLAEPTVETNYRILVDAGDGSILTRQDRTLRASARVLLTGKPDPVTEEVSPAQHQLVTIPAVTDESPSGWISGAGTSLAGNNVTSHMRWIGEPGLSEPSAVYDYPFNTLDASLVNAWWWANDAHDRYYSLGFDEPGGNFQQDNFGRGGLGGDPLAMVERQDGPTWFSPTADGIPPQISIGWSSCRYCGDHDGWPENGGDRSDAFNRTVVYHEYTHGVSTRMVGGPSDPDCLWYVQAGALGEGWSEILAASLFGGSRGCAAGEEGYGSFDARQDLDYADLCQVLAGGCEVHVDGMVWEGVLWDIRESMVALDPAGGVEKYHRIVVDSFAEIPCHPDMVDARDAMLDADTVLYGSVHHAAMWNAFARRGFGEGASSTGELDTAPVVSFVTPSAYVCSPPAAPTGLTATADGSNSVRLDYAAPGATSVEIWREDVDNPLDRPARIAFTTSSSTYTDATVQGGRNYRYHLVALGAGGATCRSAASTTAEVLATGSCAAYPIFDPQVTVSTGADCTLTLSWVSATQGCPTEPAPIVYNIYRYTQPGFEPMDSLLIGRTTATTFQDVPPQDGNAYYYFVLAQHGTLDDPPDARNRGSSQALRWAPGLPTLGRTTAQFWDFESGAQGWTTDNTADPPGGWVLVTPHGTRYGETWANPNLPAGGSGKSWVTGDAPDASVASNDAHGNAKLVSPVWDGTGGAMLLSYDYWSFTPYKGGSFRVDVSNGSQTVAIYPVRLMTAQPFDTDTDRGWQRAELDLAQYLTPTSTMQVTFVSRTAFAMSEGGIDNVRIERATSCGRSSLRIGSIAIDDTPPGWGNGNGILEPGETARVSVTLINDGTGTAASPVGRLTAGSAGLIVHEPLDDFPDIAPSSSGTSLGHGFTITAPATLRCSDTVVLDFEFEDAAGTLALSKQNLETGTSVTELVFEDTFETNKGWTVTGTAGKGIWQRGDPVGTVVGSAQANPEFDSPNDAGSQCYVTENGAVGGRAELTDVDCTNSGSPACPTLKSPPFSLAGYKRARYSFDLWYYDNSPIPEMDYTEWRSYIGNEYIWLANQWTATGGWTTKSGSLAVPMVANHSFVFMAFGYSLALGIVEMGVDNIRIEGDRPVCAPSGATHPPNGVGNSLRVTRSGGDVLVSWEAPLADPSHDSAAFYRLHVSTRPDSGFAVEDTATLTETKRASGGTPEYYLISAANAAGTSGDEPMP